MANDPILTAIQRGGVAVADDDDEQAAPSASSASSKKPRAASPKVSDPIMAAIAGGGQGSDLRTPTLDELATGTSPETQAPSLTERAASVGRSMIPLAPPKSFSVDATQIPRNPFTNELEFQPPIATEEEKAASGTLAPAPQTIGSRVKRALGAGAPAGSEMATLTGQRGTNNPDEMRLLAPEQLMTETEQQQHPILTGAGEFAGGMTTPENLALLGLTAGAGQFVGPGAIVAKRLLAAGFSMPMLIGAAQKAPEVAAAFKRGDTATAERLLTHMVLGASLAGLAGRGMFEESASPFAAEGTVSGPIAMDEATTRGARRMQDFEANAAARPGMSNLAEAESGIEAAKQARINAPVNIPALPETTEQPPILQGPTQGPEPNPLSTEAAQVREQQAEREAKNPTALKVTNTRRIGAGGEQLHPETPETLQGQVDALSDGTNKVVYFPKGQGTIPEPPENATVTVVKGNKPGAGTYYHDDSVTPQQIRAAVKNGTFGQLLGYVQAKETAVQGGNPATIVARSADGTELKAGLGDASNPRAMTAQAQEFANQFPGARIAIESPENVIAGRQASPRNPETFAPQTAVSGETPQEAGFPNASAESGASLEAIKRARRERRNGTQRVRVDTRSGQETILIGPEALDAKPGPYDRIIKRYADGREEQVTEGAKARPLTPAPQASARPAREEESAVGVHDLGEIGPIPKRDEILNAIRGTAKPQPVTERFSPETLAEARQELISAHQLASSFERPGRYFAEEDHLEGMPSRSTNAAKGIHGGGTWYGIGSSRHIVADQFPWYGEISHGAGRIGKLIEQGKGAEYNRLLGTVAESIEREKASTAPVMAEYAPKLRELSNRIDGNDRDLSDSLTQLANADGRGFKNLREYIEGKIADAEEANKFYRLVDAAANEARQTGAQGASKSFGELRAEESGRATAGAKTSAATPAESFRFNEAGETSETPQTSEAYRLTAQRERAARPTEEQNTFPGMDRAVEEQRTGAARVRGEHLGEEANQPLGSIDRAAGEMERESPLFRGKGPQGELSFETKALDELVNPDEAGELGTRYSGLAPAALKRLLPESAREKLDTEVEANQRARGLQGKLYDLESQNAADLIRAKNVLKEAPGTAEDMETIYHHLEDPGVKLNAEQQKILDGYLRPMLDASERINEKLEGGQVENYVHRIPVGKGNLLDRIMGDEGKLSAGRGLSKSTGSLKGRTMMALEDEAGDRRVVSIKDGKVTAFDQGQAEDLGRIRGLETQGIKSRGAVLDRELEPMQRELDKLETERRTLTATKSREAAATKRIENIENRQAELREALQDAYRTDEGRLLSENDLRGRVFVDKNGKQWKIGQATTKEIEANTDTRYYKNALASTVLNYLQLRRAERAYDFLESYKNSPEFQQVAVKSNGRRVPVGWRPTELPQFHGYAFEPHTAEVLDWYAKRMHAEGPNLYRQIGNFLRTAIFFNPLIHTPNIGVHWIVEKGLTGFGPQNFGRILRTGSRAINAVIHQNQDFLDALDQGAPLQSARLDNGATTDLLIDRMGRELEKNPTAAQKVASALGYVNPARLVRAIYRFSGKATWVSNDVAMLQATYQHMEQTGSSFKDAVTDVSKHIPDYRLPTRIFNSTALAKLMSSPDLTMFGAYHYGALRSYAEMAKGLISEDMPPAERMKSVDRLAMLGLFTFVAYPALDQLAKYLTGDKTAEFRRAGASTFIYNLAQLAKGEKSPTQVLEAVATPAVHTKALLQLALNRDFFTGRHIVDWNAPAKTIAAQLARYGGQNLAPVNQGMQVADRRRTMGQQVAGLAGIKTNVPTPAGALARKFAAESAGTAVPDQDTLERSYLRKQYENDLRDKKITLKDLGQALTNGKITVQDTKTIIQRAVNTPLQNDFKGLPIEQALRVWQKADAQEQQSLRPLLIAKVKGLNTDKYNGAQLADLRAKIIGALTGNAAKTPPLGLRTTIPLGPPRGGAKTPQRPSIAASAQE